MRGVTKRTFRALENRNYRLFFGGQLISVTGSWLQSTAQAWLILDLTHSAFMLGLLVMFQFLPNLLLQPLGGVVADRFPKRRTLVVTQSSFMVVAGLLGLAVGFHFVQTWEVFVVVLAFGLINVVDGPTRQAFVPEMVGFRQLPNAVALNSSVFNGARVVGPAVGGILIATVGTALCFDLNAISYLAVIWALLLMRPQELHITARSRTASGTLAQIREGAVTARHTPEVLLVILMMLVVGTFSYNLSVLIPALARQGLHVGAAGFGLLSAALGVGALLGALGIAYSGRATVRALLAGCAVFGIFLALAGTVPSLPLAMVVLALAGAGMIIYSAVSNSIIQMRSPAALRGRVMSLYLWVFMGTTPIGSPLTGWFEQTLGTRTTMAISGSVAVAAALVGAALWRRRRSRGGYAPSSTPSEVPRLADAPIA